MIKELDSVVLKHDIRKYGLKKGDIGDNKLDILSDIAHGNLNKLITKCSMNLVVQLETKLLMIYLPFRNHCAVDTS